MDNLHKLSGKCWEWTNSIVIFEKLPILKNLKHRIDMFMNELQRETKFKKVKECFVSTCYHVQGHFLMSISCVRGKNSTLAFGYAKELGKNPKIFIMEYQNKFTYYILVTNIVNYFITAKTGI